MMFQKLLKVTFYAIKKLQHRQPPTAPPALTGPDRTGPPGSLLTALTQGGPTLAGPVHGSVSCELLV